jgi:hypothetical protein
MTEPPVDKPKVHHVEITATLKTSVSMDAVGIRVGQSRRKGWFKRIRSYLAAQVSRGGRKALIERTFERGGDYSERVTMTDTGEVIHEIKEPLVEHQGHGSAKLPGRKP